MRLEQFSTLLNKQNMQRRLFGLYVNQVGRDKATKPGYNEWLYTVIDWFDAHALENSEVEGYEELLKEAEERVKLENDTSRKSASEENGDPE